MEQGLPLFDFPIPSRALPVALLPLQKGTTLPRESAGSRDMGGGALHDAQQIQPHILTRIPLLLPPSSFNRKVATAKSVSQSGNQVGGPFFAFCLALFVCSAVAVFHLLANRWKTGLMFHFSCILSTRKKVNVRGGGFGGRVATACKAFSSTGVLHRIAGLRRLTRSQAVGSW